MVAREAAITGEIITETDPIAAVEVGPGATWEAIWEVRSLLSKLDASHRFLLSLSPLIHRYPWRRNGERVRHPDPIVRGAGFHIVSDCS